MPHALLISLSFRTQHRGPYVHETGRGRVYRRSRKKAEPGLLPPLAPWWRPCGRSHSRRRPPGGVPHRREVVWCMAPLCAQCSQRPRRQGRQPNGHFWQTCCRRCAITHGSEHDHDCNAQPAAPSAAASPQNLIAPPAAQASVQPPPPSLSDGAGPSSAAGAGASSSGSKRVRDDDPGDETEEESDALEASVAGAGAAVPSVATGSDDKITLRVVS